jgi:hypothetical protein
MNISNQWLNKIKVLSCGGLDGSTHEYGNPVPLTEVLNETSYVTRKGQRFFCKNCGWHKDVFG